MAMQMQRAFNAKMLSPITRYSILAGAYDDNNVWVEGKKISSRVFGVIKAGNKFSQFDEGIAIHNEVGGIRTSDYRTLYINDRYTINIEDKLGFNGTYFNIIQQSDEGVYGFNSYIIEKDKTWRPNGH